MTTSAPRQMMVTTWLFALKTAPYSDLRKTWHQVSFLAYPSRARSGPCLNHDMIDVGIVDFTICLHIVKQDILDVEDKSRYFGLSCWIPGSMIKFRGPGKIRACITILQISEAKQHGYILCRSLRERITSFCILRSSIVASCCNIPWLPVKTWCTLTPLLT